MKIALIQPDSRGDKDEILQRAINLIKKASSMEAEIACLPEHWIHVKNFKEIIPHFIKAAKENKIAIITGGNYVEEKGKREIKSFLIDSEGEIIGEQNKVHLFKAEKEIAIPGEEYNVFELNNTKIAITICNDLVYPEVVRILVLKGAEIIFAPSRIKDIGYEPWKLYVLTRALENRVHIASPNTFLPPSFLGKSIVVDFEIKEDVVIPKIFASAKEEEDILIADLDPKKVEGFRKERLNDRRVETYSELIKKLIKIK